MSGRVLQKNAEVESLGGANREPCGGVTPRLRFYAGISA